ncbi:MAG: prolyl oligopeptidase family serine peptidase [Leptospiraceae bacterium]|nr:prolyl oligopeptidase family serine peptidase [Leptospiraceae bacterium]
MKVETFVENKFEKKPLSYILYLPDTYETSKKKWPLLLFLHGAGERGADLELLKKHGPPKMIREENFHEPFIILAPQCPKGSWWPDRIDELKELIDEIQQTYRINPRRIYLSGMSMGGYGTWAMAKKYPDSFAAFNPICGGGETENLCVLKDKPIWVFHGAKDTVVPLQKSEEMVKALKDCGKEDTIFTIYPEAKHNSWEETYENPELYRWLLKYKLPKTEK